VKVLVVEDTQSLVSNLFEYLEPRGYDLDVAPDGATGLHLAITNDYDVIVVDWMLPRLDGSALVVHLRKKALKRTPVIMLTARTDIEDKVTALGIGADDYLTKPFAMAELEARLQALDRRARQGQSGRTLRVGDLELDLDTLAVQRGEQEVRLYPACRRLLECMMRASPSVVSRHQLEQALWGDDPPRGDQLRAHISVLRRAIDGPYPVKLLHTIPKLGYRLASAPEGTDVA
jgi:DNA-binding response OmpR family regulator